MVILCHSYWKQSVYMAISRFFLPVKYKLGIFDGKSMLHRIGYASYFTESDMLHASPNRNCFTMKKKLKQCLLRANSRQRAATLKIQSLRVVRASHLRLCRCAGRASHLRTSRFAQKKLRNIRRITELMHTK